MPLVLNRAINLTEMTNAKHLWFSCNFSFSLSLVTQSQSLADMHLSSLQREKESRFRKNIPKNFSVTSFTIPMQTDGDSYGESKWAGFLRPTGYKPMIVLFFLFLIQQFSGIYITLFYAVTFMQVSCATVAVIIINLPFTFSTAQ